MSVTNSLIERLSDSCTALVCNALDALSIHVPYMDGTIKCLSPELSPIVGQAITIKLDSSTRGGDSKTELYWRLLEEMEKNPLPQVVVVQAVGENVYRECIAVDGMAKTFMSVGAVGLVTNGGIRDIRSILDQGFKIFGLGPVVQHEALRWSALGEPVNIGGIEVKTGDLIHGDADGCIIIPEASYGRIVEACCLVANFEKKAHVLLRQKGITLSQKRIEMDKLVKELNKNIIESVI
jgi:4-hydroxy-4-methyl-2-oxoglutarate aldolase